MKKQYINPELGTKVYAQFENVFTNCNQDAAPCESNPGQGGVNPPGDPGNPGTSWDYGFGGNNNS